MKKSAPKRRKAQEKLKTKALLSDLTKSVVEILNVPQTEESWHRAFKPDHRILALWAADCAEHVLAFFEEKHPADQRPRKALETCRNWAVTGEFHMADIRKASLDSHAAAREAKDDAACFAARAAGQAVATAHVPTHALGAAIYGIKAAIAHSGKVEDGLVGERRWQLQRLRKLKSNGLGSGKSSHQPRHISPP
jgi:hypothetical protein